MTKISQLDFDVRKFKAAKSLHDLEKLFQMIDWDRFHAAWQELEKSPVDAATMAIFYCENWANFCVLAEAYGVTKEQSPELNQKFRDRLKEKGLNSLVLAWYQQNKEAA